MERLGRYELVRALGRGSAGTVYEAVQWEDGRGRTVALKVLQQGADDLQQEAMLGALLRHHNLVDVYEVGQADGRWYCAMELCGGGALEGRGVLPPRAAVEVGLAVCSALQYAHEAMGLVHLDLKPRNLMLTADGVVKVADLGIARARGFDQAIRQGTPGYMAPEQARGEPVDARADIYALGVTLQELVTGERPGGSATLELDVWAVGASEEAGATLDLEGWEQPVEWRRASVPDGLDPVLERCLAPDPEARWASMAELGEALAALQVSGPGLREVLGLEPAAPTEGASAGVFVGREAELERVGDLLCAPGLVALKGAAGVGKSRLAEEAARRWREAGRGEAFRCDLGEIRSREGLVFAVAGALDLSLQPEDPARQIAHALAGRGPVVLVLDSVERVGDALGLVQRWRELAPEVRIVLTSRQALALEGVEVLEVEPLTAAASEALLVYRAAERGVDVREDPALPELARRLDGLPLALELAAGRLGVLSVTDVLERLGLELLRRGTADRHGTLRAALDWSWEQLTGTEQAVMAQLSVFVGGFTAAAAEAVVEAPVQGAIEPILVRLVDQSLVQRRAERLHLLSSVREYAAEQLVAREAAEERHGRYLARMGTEEALHALEVRGGVERERALATWLEDLVVAHDRAVRRGDADVAAPIARAAFRVLSARGPLRLAMELQRQTLNLTGVRPSLHAAVERDLGQALKEVGDLQAAQVHLKAAVDRSRARGDRLGEGRGHLLVAALMIELGDLVQAGDHLAKASQSLRIAGTEVERGAVASLGVTRCRMEGRIDEAHRHALQALQWAEASGGERAMGRAWTRLADCALERGRMDHASEFGRRAVAVHARIGHRSMEASARLNLANVLVYQGRVEEARVHYEAARETAAELGLRRTEVSVQLNFGLLHQHQGRCDQALSCVRRAIALAQQIGARNVELHARVALGSMHHVLGQTAEARAAYEAALSRLRGDRSLEAKRLPEIMGNLGTLLGEQGDWEAARALTEEALSMAGSMGSGAMLGVLRVQRAHLELAQGRPEAARQAVDGMLEEAGASGQTVVQLLVLTVLGEVARLESARDTALTHLTAALDLLDDGALPYFVADLLCRLAVVRLERGELDRARAAVDRAEMRARGFPRHLACALAVRAQVHLAVGEVGEARQDVDRAVDLQRRGAVGARVRVVDALVAAAEGEGKRGRAALVAAQPLLEGIEPDSELPRLARLAAERLEGLG